MKAPIEFRQAEASDLPILKSLEDACFDKRLAMSPKELASLISRPNGIAIVALRGGAVIAFAAGRVLRRGSAVTGRIETVEVLPEYQGIGVGKILLARIEGGLRAEGCIRIYLEVEAKNTRAWNLYLADGWRAVRRIPNYYGWRRAGVRMVKEFPREPGESDDT